MPRILQGRVLSICGGAILGIVCLLLIQDAHAKLGWAGHMRRLFGAETTIKRTGDVTLVIHASTATPTDEQALFDIRTGTGAGTSRFSIDDDGDMLILDAGEDNSATITVADLFFDRTYTFDGASGTIWTSGNDTNTSGLNADTLDGQQGAAYLRSNTSDSFTSGTLTVSATLDVTGNLAVADTSVVLDGASTDFAATGDITFNTNNLVIVKSTGNVGIGTTTPGSTGSAKLEIYGTSGSGTAGPNLVLKGDADIYPMFSTFMFNHDDMNLLFDAYNNGNYRSSDAGSNMRIRKAADQMTIDAGSGNAVGNTIAWSTLMNVDVGTGNTAIGTGSTASQRLEVNGAVKLGTTASNVAGSIRWNGTNFQGYDGSTWDNLDASGSSEWTDGGAFLRPADGTAENVSIGTTTNGSKLDVYSTGEMFRLIDSSATGQPIIGFYQQATNRAQIRYTDSGDELSFLARYGDIGFLTGTGGSSVRRVTIDETGNVAIGLNAPNEKLMIQGVVSIQEGSAPSDTSGYGKLYVDTADSALKFRDDGGTTYDLTASSSEWTDSGTFLRPADAVTENVSIGTSTNGARLEVFTNASYGTGPSVVIDNSENINSQSTIALQIEFSNGTSTGTDDKWAMFSRLGTERGSISGNGDTNTVNYNAFTGSHIAHSPSPPTTWRRGMLVRSIGNPGFCELSGANVEIELTSTAYDKAVMGVFIGTEFPHQLGGYDPDRVAIYFNALGDGSLLVTDQGGDIEIGDYITSSDMPGYGMRQADDLLHNYTVAKATDSVSWDEIDVDPEFGFKWVLLPCTYHGG